MSLPKTDSGPSFQTVKDKMYHRKLFDENLRDGQIYCFLKLFMRNTVKDWITETSHYHRIDWLKHIFSCIQKAMKNNLKKIWMKTLTVHALFRLLISGNYHKKQQILEIISEQTQAMISQLSHKNFQEQQSSFSLISKSLSKIKRSLSIKSFQKFIGGGDEKISTQKDTFQSLRHAVMLEYLTYLEKLISEWHDIEPYIVVPVQNQTDTSPVKKDKPKQVKSKVVWKLFNFFKRLSKLGKDIQRICRLLKDFTIYMLATINFIVEDLELLYCPIFTYIKQQIQNIRWQEVNNNLNQRQKIGQKQSKLPDYLADEILELKSMMDEFGNVNQAVLYFFHGSFHHEKLYGKRKPKCFISINDFQFDMFFEVAKKLENKKRKSSFDNKKFVAFNPENHSKPLTFNNQQINFSNKPANGMNAVSYKSSKLKEMIGSMSSINKPKVEKIPEKVLLNSERQIVPAETCQRLNH